jgi:GNAT superfamily N-acetyltransferase
MEFTAERLEVAGFGRATEILGEEAIGRFGAVMNHLEALHHRDMPIDHWYLFGMGVDPTRQGQGIGGQLLQPILRKADATGVPCYLETQKERNVPFYRRHGFEVTVETDIPGGGPHFWIMQRHPKTA